MTMYLFFMKDVNLEYINLKIGCVALAQHAQARVLSAEILEIDSKLLTLRYGLYIFFTFEPDMH